MGYSCDRPKDEVVTFWWLLSLFLFLFLRCGVVDMIRSGYLFSWSGSGVGWLTDSAGLCRIVVLMLRPRTRGYGV